MNFFKGLAKAWQDRGTLFSFRYFDDGSFKAGQPAVDAMARAMKVCLDRVTCEGGETGTPNYVQWNMVDPEDPGKEYILLLQRKSGRSPHQLRLDAEAELARTKEEFAKKEEIFAICSREEFARREQCETLKRENFALRCERDHQQEQLTILRNKVTKLYEEEGVQSPASMA